MGLLFRICRDLGVLDPEDFYALPLPTQRLWVAYYQAELGGDFLPPKQR